MTSPFLNLVPFFIFPRRMKDPQCSPGEQGDSNAIEIFLLFCRQTPGTVRPWSSVIVNRP
jgi:hypothetical protein